jgi:ribose transport system ATP-binding protein
MGATPPALEVVGLTKVYGATVALGGAELSVAPGEVHALLGENGAGKSTLVRILAGVEAQDRGVVRLFGEELPVPHRPGHVAGRRGAFIHQDLALLDELSVAENVALVAGYRTRRRLISWSRTRAAARDILGRLELQLDVDAPVGELPPGRRALVAIARALALDARLLVLDEPTANLQEQDVHAFLRVLGRARAQGVACLLITHRLDDVVAACDRATVLRDGSVVAVVDVAGLAERDLVTLVLGHEPGEARPPGYRSRGSEVLRVEDLRSEAVGPVSFTLRKGEILALTGLQDSGHLAVGEALFGLVRRAGHVELQGETYRAQSPHEAIQAGLGYVPPQRTVAGVAGLTLRENLFLNPRQPALAPLASDERAASKQLLARFGVRPPDPERLFSTMSGGNQQKTVVARWLSGQAEVLVLAEPTAAVDVGARADISRHVRQSCTIDGRAVLLLSSDFDEVVDLADRAIVLRRGRLAAELRRPGLTAASLAAAAFTVNGEVHAWT